MYIVLKDLMLKGKRFAASEILDNISDDDAKKLKAINAWTDLTKRKQKLKWLIGLLVWMKRRSQSRDPSKRSLSNGSRDCNRQGYYIN